MNAPAAMWVNDEGWVSVHCFDCRRNDELREVPVVPAPAQPSFTTSAATSASVSATSATTK